MQQTQPQTTPVPPTSKLGLTIQRQGANPTANTEAFPVRSIEITGNTLLPTGMLHALVASGEGKNLTLNDLDALADRITQVYHDHGYPLDRAYVPAQVLHDGVVRIAVLEARYGNVSLQNNSAVSDRPLHATLSPLQSGQQITERTLESSLLLLSDIPGAVVSSVLRPGATPGTSDLSVDVTSAPRYSGVLGVDNYGNKYTDRFRIGGTFDINGLFHQGDLLGLDALTSGHDMSYGRIGYRYLLNGEGTTLGAATSGLEYHLSNGLSALNAHGTAQVDSIILLQPFIRNTAYNIYGQIEYDHRRLRDDIDVASIENNRHTDSWTGSISGDQRDRNGISNVSVGVTFGRLAFDNTIAEFIDSLGPRTQGSYAKFDVSVSRLQQLNSTNALYFAFLATLSSINLDTSEQFYLGGPNTVRGYDVGAIAGAEGNLETVEYRHDFSIPPLPGPWQVALFADSGYVQVYKTPFVSGPNTFRIDSIGLGLHWSAPHAWVFSVSAATPIGGRPAVTGIDSGKVRCWAQIQKGFQ